MLFEQDAINLSLQWVGVAWSELMCAQAEDAGAFHQTLHVLLSTATYMYKII